MTDQQQDAQVGGLIREHGTLRKEIASLRVEASRIGTILTQSGQLLSAHAENVIFQAQPHHMMFKGPTFNPRDFDAEHILKVTNELRDKIVRREEVARNLKNLDINVDSL
jgi:hypothetical protein